MYEALLACARNTDSQVVDVRSAWAKLHALPDREFAPPPVILPFVVTAIDFEDAMIWHASTRPTLGLQPFDPLEAMTNPEFFEQNGTVPQGFRSRLERIFGTPYEAPAVLDRMCMDRPPREYGIRD